MEPTFMAGVVQVQSSRKPRWEDSMRKVIFAAACTVALMAATGGANADPLGGAIIGGATGAAIGGAVGGGRGAAVGAAVGATTGAAVGAETDGPYYYGHRHWRHRHCWVNHWGHEHCRYY
jgi:uncharacterized protein YcfJ